MRVALHTAKRRALPNLPSGVHAVNQRGGSKFLVHGSRFIVVHGVAVKRRGNQLVIGGLGQQIARQLLFGKLIKRLVGVEGLHHPVAVPPNVASVVFLVTARVGIPRQIKPHRRPTFAVSGRGQQFVYQLFVGQIPVLGVAVFLNNGGRGRQSR